LRTCSPGPDWHRNRTAVLARDYPWCKYVLLLALQWLWSTSSWTFARSRGSSLHHESLGKAKMSTSKNILTAFTRPTGPIAAVAVLFLIIMAIIGLHLGANCLSDGPGQAAQVPRLRIFSARQSGARHSGPNPLPRGSRSSWRFPPLRLPQRSAFLWADS